MKVLIQFAKPFSVSCKISENENKEILIQPGEYEAEVIEVEERFVVSHPTFFISVPRDEWRRGKFFIENDICLRYLEKVEIMDQ